MRQSTQVLCLLPVTESRHAQQSSGTGMARGDVGYSGSRDIAALKLGAGYILS
jgi:hypothetical protein